MISPEKFWVKKQLWVTKNLGQTNFLWTIFMSKNLSSKPLGSGKTLISKKKLNQKKINIKKL